MPDKYVTVQGDTWDMISARVYGSESYMGILINANPEYVEIVIFPANRTLYIPELPEPSPSENLPPWRR